MTIGTRIRDWWRGYTDSDAATMVVKLTFTTPKPGAIMQLTEAEARAMIATRKAQAKLDRIAAEATTALNP